MIQSSRGSHSPIAPGLRPCAQSSYARRRRSSTKHHKCNRPTKVARLFYPSSTYQAIALAHLACTGHPLQAAEVAQCRGLRLASAGDVERALDALVAQGLVERRREKFARRQPDGKLAVITLTRYAVAVKRGGG